MTETQERFLRAIVARVPIDDVVEVHLFPPIRRGTLETGVAVLAVSPPPVMLVVEPQTDVDASVDVSVDVAVDADVEVALVPEVDVSVDAATDASDASGAADTDSDAGTADVLEDEAATDRAPRAPRLRILTANYRATIKGPDRGKWIVDVQEEADAPLDAVEAVLRGVRQRSAEPADPELVSPEVLRALVATVAVAPAA
jgi:hypothetical protein